MTALNVAGMQWRHLQVGYARNWSAYDLGRPHLPRGDCLQAGVYL
jgi:hypothetical protein